MIVRVRVSAIPPIRPYKYTMGEPITMVSYRRKLDPYFTRKTDL